MRNLVLAFLATLFLSGCASPQPQHRYFVSYEKMLADSTFETMRDRPDIPWDVKFAYSDCSAAYAMTLVTPAERSRLDAYARGQSITNAELQEIDSRINQRGGALDFDDLNGICPDKVPLFKQYIKPL